MTCMKLCRSDDYNISSVLQVMKELEYQEVDLVSISRLVYFFVDMSIISALYFFVLRQRVEPD